MRQSLHSLLCITSTTMNEEPRNKEVNAFVDPGENKTDSDNQTHSERASLEAHEFPEGGLRAWLVVSGSAATMFCTFGYLTGFGYGRLTGCKLDSAY